GAVLIVASLLLVGGDGEEEAGAGGKWTGNKQCTHACYPDVIPLWGAERLDAGAVPYRDNAVEYPVLTGGVMWATAGVTRAVHAVFDHQDEGVLFAILTSIGLAACGLLALAGTVGAARARPYDAALFALSPLLVFHAFSNWDLLAMALAACALWAWARSRPVAAGVLLGLGVAAKLYPIFLLVPIAVLAVRTARYRPAIWCTVATAATWLAVNLPFAAAYYHGRRGVDAGRARRGSQHILVYRALPGNHRLRQRIPARMVAAWCGGGRSADHRARRRRYARSVGPRTPTYGAAGVPRSVRVSHHHQGMEPAV